MPRSFYHVALVLLLTGGCTPPGQQDQGKKGDPASALPQTLTVKYKGQTADFWGARLLDRDEDASQEAGNALAMIGPEGLRFVLDGLKSEVWLVRLNAAGALSSTGKPYAQAFRAPLLKMLTDPVDFEGRAKATAARAIQHLGLKELLPEVTKAKEAKDNSDASRQTIQQVIDALSN